MGVINEKLTLTDQFSATFRTFIDLGNKAVATTQVLDKSLSRAVGKSAGATIGAIRQLGDQASQTNQLLEQIVANQERHTEETKRTSGAAGGLLKTFTRIATATGAAGLVKLFLGASDAQAQTNARLELMNDGLQSTEELQNMIYASAQRTRTAYSETANMVASLGQRAKDAFDSSAEVVQFAENLNKQFIIAGAGQQEIASASLQLTQALGAGVLRGEELNAVFEAAPSIIQTIVDYMGEPIGSIRRLASEGRITADIVKNAMLSATDNINAQFEDMPMTLSQAFTMGKNKIQKSLQDSFAGWSDFLNSASSQRALNQMADLLIVIAQVGVGTLGAIGRGALFVADNLDFIIPILIAIGAYLTYVKIQAALTAGFSVSAALASAQAWLVAHWPILLIISALAAAMIAAQQFGIGMQEIGMVVGGVLGFIFAVGYNVFATLWNVIATFAEFFANVFNNPVAAIVGLFTNALDVILGMVETVASAIDALLDTNISGAISGFRGKLSGWLDSSFGADAVEIKRMANLDIGATASQWSSYGGNLGSKLDNMDLNLDSLAGSFGGFDASSIPTFGGGEGLGDVGKVGSVGNVKNIEGNVKLSDEDLKLYRDLAEQRYMNRIELKTLAPNINVSLPAGASGKPSAEDVADEIKKMLIAQMAAQTAISHG